MTTQGVRFTQEDRLVMKSYSNMLSGLAQYLGDGYELVLHSLEEGGAPSQVAYGGATGSTAGQAAETAEAALRRLLPEGGDPQESACYNRLGPHGEPMRCTALAIRGQNRQMIGILCVSFFMNTPLNSLLRSVTASITPPHAPSEVTMQNTTSIVRDALDRATQTVDGQGVLPSLRNRRIVTFLYEEGIFNIKDSVYIVADQMGLSRNTVYLHLRHCKGLD